MAKKGSTNPEAEALSVNAAIEENPNFVLHRFLTENNITLNVEVLDEQAPFAGDGFVLTDKPLIKIKAIYKENNA